MPTRTNGPKTPDALQAESTHVAQLRDPLPQKAAADAERLVRLDEVLRLTGLGRSSVYAGQTAGTFPHCVQISERAVAWRLSEVQAWISNPVPAPSRRGTGAST